MVTGGLSTIASFSVFNFLVHGLYLTKDPWLGAQPIRRSSSPTSSAWWSATAEPELDVPPPPAGARRRRAHGVLRDQPRHDADLDLLPVVQPPRPAPDRPARGQRRRPTWSGALIGQAARFYLFRRFVFRKPVTWARSFHPLRPDRTSRSTRAGRGRRLSRHAQRSVQAWPSSPSRSRSSGRLSPTTLWWSPSIPVTKAPPSPSTVNAPATCERLAGGDVRRDLGVGDVREVHDRRRRRRGARCRPPCRAGSGRCAARRSGRASPASGVRRPSASSGLPSASPSSSSTESQPRTSAPSVTSVGHGVALELGQPQREVGRRQPRDPTRRPPRRSRRVHAGRAERGEPGR